MTGRRSADGLGTTGDERSAILPDVPAVAEAGEPADVVVLSRALVKELARSGHVIAASMAMSPGSPPLSRCEAAMHRPRSATRPDRRPRLPPPKRYISRSGAATAGIHFAKVMRELGIWDRAAGRLRLAPNGNTAMRALAASAARHPIGCTQETEIRATAGVVLVGPLPPGCDLATVYTAAVTSTSSAPGEAARFVARLSAP